MSKHIPHWIRERCEHQHKRHNHMAKLAFMIPLTLLGFASLTAISVPVINEAMPHRLFVDMEPFHHPNMKQRLSFGVFPSKKQCQEQIGIHMKMIEGSDYPEGFRYNVWCAPELNNPEHPRKHEA